MIDINDIDSFGITISVLNKDINEDLGILEIAYVIDGTLSDGNDEGRLLFRNQVQFHEYLIPILLTLRKCFNGKRR